MNVLQSEEEARCFVADRCDVADFRRLEELVARLAGANEGQNLVSRASLESVWLRHIADSAQLLDHAPPDTSPWLDLGTGAGMPGLVLAIIQPSRQFVLVESRNLRIQWLRDIIERLRVDNSTLIPADLRDVASFNAAVISARAFAPLDRLVAQSARFSTAATRWVLPKGRSAAQEVVALHSSLRPMFHVKQSVTANDAGIVIGMGQVELDT